MTQTRQPQALPDFVLKPIGVVYSPFVEKKDAPRQPAAARDVVGRIELFATPGMEHAVSDLDGCDHLWVIFVFHLAGDFRPKVLPPRSAEKRRGVLATRSPHRPNPIGLSVVRLDRVDGLTLHVRDVDMLDGTPVLDVKPYVPYTDSVPHARVAWLTPLVEDALSGATQSAAQSGGVRDPERGFEVIFGEDAKCTLEFLKESFGLDLGPSITQVLSLGPQPHPYRRIKKTEAGLVLALKDWRVHFRAEGRVISVESIETGYRPKQLAMGGPNLTDMILAPHRALSSRKRP
ncbi:MAG: tRNA (N6-threonylcarbamoyladenosine(37)-N6)-methyltransferase TrmO [Polyangiaceae bacterium]|nr:tRNA (N6-threonylcarbamoyladenosine(37)-N6)-methyltransferase TrmO [Polyangiaceae bacterium]